MARIYFEYTKNTFLEYPDYFMFALFIITSFMLISISDVLTNIPKDSFPHAFNFFVIALRNTSLIMQILIAGFFIRVVVGGAILTYKTINTKWPITKLIRLRY
ncbi:MAG: hypothetical protein UT00_C0002G0021 [Parcubacteria group bacterium GW2011_GWA1_38_7]|nr:MAG: hypothetical protein UT00_C0002G0021 [Parcubacteria group bacterium GW2011_GWA1_38_7]